MSTRTPVPHNNLCIINWNKHCNTSTILWSTIVPFSRQLTASLGDPHAVSRLERSTGLRGVELHRNFSEVKRQIKTAWLFRNGVLWYLFLGYFFFKHQIQDASHYISGHSPSQFYCWAPRSVFMLSFARLEKLLIFNVKRIDTLATMFRKLPRPKGVEFEKSGAGGCGGSTVFPCLKFKHRVVYVSPPHNSPDQLEGEVRAAQCHWQYKILEKLGLKNSLRSYRGHKQIKGVQDLKINRRIQ